ncbi:hypothetical protein RYH80_08780 [Halobaculum sp. MBLA0147]|uniref:hypothetical protein n=1 Tax=Halobaculum sp. MBLA0147 TaxID=3079934 RepID=UPI003523970A
MSDATRRPTTEGSPRLRRRVAGSAAATEPLPTAVRAVLGYYADTGDLAVDSLELKRHVDTFLDRVLQEAFDPVEAALAEAFEVPRADVAFAYDTKLTLPAELTLSHLFGRVRAETTPRLHPLTGRLDFGPLGLLRGLRGDDGVTRAALVDARERLSTIREVTRLVVVALLDGDMRDAINDEEYGDFDVGFAVDDAERARVAEVAQTTLERRVEELFEQFPDAVRERYDEAVARSEAHQNRDPYFRELMERAEAGDEAALTAVAEEYRDATFEDPPELFDETELEFPYLRTQYGRVGVIYHGMIEMYRAAGIEIEPAFERSIVFAIVGAQIWLDDVDDYHADAAEGQLTPVTAEYLLADDEAAAVERVVAITDRYLDAAKAYAAATDSGLAGIGADYIRRSGSTAPLPGGE